MSWSETNWSRGVPRRIIAKAVLRTIRKDIEEVAGHLQVCAGQDGGCEAAVHAMHIIFQDADTESCLLVDASNAFNSLNRRAALHNVSVLCPPFSPVQRDMFLLTCKVSVFFFVFCLLFFSSLAVTIPTLVFLCIYTYSICIHKNCSLKEKKT